VLSFSRSLRMARESETQAAPAINKTSRAQKPRPRRRVFSRVPAMEGALMERAGTEGSF
jgi:hypothetical protein